MYSTQDFGDAHNSYLCSFKGKHKKYSISYNVCGPTAPSAYKEQYKEA